MIKRWRAVITLTLPLLLGSFVGCANKPALSVGTDGRGCLVGVVDSTEAAILRAKNPAVLAGDFVMTAACAESIGADLHNEIYELTR